VSPDPTRRPLTEVSAGGLIYKRVGEDLLFALVRDNFNVWTFPKGKVEPGETPEQAALREIAEEVGLGGVSIESYLGETKYRFLSGDRPVRKRVHWFLVAAPPQAEIYPQAAERILDGGWFRPQPALQTVGYRSLRRVLRAALAQLGQPPA
jgi:8-oxo-dGTP pyrophosphatase MutT (NUDIX family)